MVLIASPLLRDLACPGRRVERCEVFQHGAPKSRMRSTAQIARNASESENRPDDT